MQKEGYPNVFFLADLFIKKLLYFLRMFVTLSCVCLQCIKLLRLSN